MQLILVRIKGVNNVCKQSELFHISSKQICKNFALLEKEGLMCLKQSKKLTYVLKYKQRPVLLVKYVCICRGLENV